MDAVEPNFPLNMTRGRLNFVRNDQKKQFFRDEGDLSKGKIQYANSADAQFGTTLFYTPCNISTLECQKTTALLEKESMKMTNASPAVVLGYK